MRKSTTKILAYSISLALILGCSPFGMTSAKASSEDGDIVTNPWHELFTGEHATTDSDNIELLTTKANASEKDTTNVKNNSANNNTNVNQYSSNSSKVTIKRVKIKKLKRLSNKKHAKITLKKIKGAKGYQIKYSTSKKFKKKVTKTVNTTKRIKTVKKLKTYKKYYFKARAYKLVNGKKNFGKWSKVKILKKV